MIHRDGETGDRSGTVEFRCTVKSFSLTQLIHTGVVSVIDLLRKTTVHCSVWFIRYLRLMLCFD